jgi:hypothetical protein
MVFVPSAGGAIAAGASFTLYYPDNFFAKRSVSEPLPTVNCSSDGATVEGVVTEGSLEQDWIAVTITGVGVIAASQSATVIFNGLNMGMSAAPNATGITMKTSQDQVQSLPFDTGRIAARLILHVFAIKFTDAVAGKLDSTATIIFETGVAGLVPPGGKIILKYYDKGFFGTSQIPLFSCSVPLVAGTAAFVDDNAAYSSIVITTGGTNSIPSSSVVTITLSGLTMGPVSDSAPVVLDTSSEHDSLPDRTGPIYSRDFVSRENIIVNARVTVAPQVDKILDPTAFDDSGWLWEVCLPLCEIPASKYCNNLAGMHFRRLRPGPLH